LPDAWLGDHPYCLLVVPGGDRPVTVDLDQHHWDEVHRQALDRTPATWHLVRKDGIPVFSMVVLPGEEPGYAARHILGDREVVAHGLRKKCHDGCVQSLWILPNGQVCAGSDVEQLAAALL
jgi:hypothetical protein